MKRIEREDVIRRFRERLQPPEEAVFWIQNHWEDIGDPALAVANVDGLDAAVTELRNLYAMSCGGQPLIFPMKDE